MFQEGGGGGAHWTELGKFVKSQMLGLFFRQLKVTWINWLTQGNTIALAYVLMQVGLEKHTDEIEKKCVCPQFSK